MTQMRSSDSLRTRIERKKNEMAQYNHHKVQYCIHGEIVGGTKCKLHTDELTDRIGNLVHVLMEDFHEIDYDSCSWDEQGMTEMIKQFVAGEDVEAEA